MYINSYTLNPQQKVMVKRHLAPCRAGAEGGGASHQLFVAWHQIGAEEPCCTQAASTLGLALGLWTELSSGQVETFWPPTKTVHDRGHV